MLKNSTINIKVIEKVANALGELNENVIYVGGAIVSYYVTDEGAEQPRPTKDIDISVQISTYAEMEILREQLAKKDIFPATNQNVLYRFEYDDILIDFIPYETTPLGPTNSWLKPGFQFAYEEKAGLKTIKLLPVSYFLATKFEAFRSRGNNDPYVSHDFEDIIYVLDNNIEVVFEIAKSQNTVINFMKEMAAYILNHPSRNDIIATHINPYTSKERIPMLIEKLSQIQEL